MSDDQHASNQTPSLAPNDNVQRPMILIWVGVGLLTISWMVFGSGAAFEQLIFGWLYFAVRVIPQMTVDLPTLLVGVFALIGFVFLLRHSIRFLAEHRSWPDSKRQQWTSWGMTIRLTCGLLLLFVAGTAIVGLAHQSIWLVTGRDADHADRSEAPHVFSLSEFTGLRNAIDAQTKNDLHELSLAVQNYSDVNYGRFPAGGTLTPDGRPLHGWMTFIGPYVTFTTYEVDFSTPFNAPPNDRLFRCGLNDAVVRGVTPEFDEEGFGLAHIAANVKLFPVMTSSGDPTRDDALIAWDDLADGGANTLMIGEARGDFHPWGSPWNVRDASLGLNTSSQSFGTPLPRDFSLHVMADGSVREFSHAIDQDVFRQLGSPSVGEAF